MNIAENAEEEPRIRLCDRATIYAKACSAVLVVAMVMQITAQASSYWAAGYANGAMIWHEGLWHNCFLRRDRWLCGAYVANHHADRIPGWVKACQALSVIGLLMAFPAFYIVQLYAMVPRLGNKRIAYIVSTGLSLFAGLFTLLGPIIFAASYPTLPSFTNQNVRYHWSFGLEIIAALSCFVSVGLQITEMYKSMLLFH
ncbi:uncharacterized protein LOC121376770 [Gigantopelta aegis]|uniref:uncharacterized protein LOC121376770 n=1 Tax=Gigantopelta aegis TaxID=1735272 RepID=UPI001B8888FC|nr:uncharacterized protein LOC121376770 [Gigantopelta aegis]